MGRPCAFPTANSYSKETQKGHISKLCFIKKKSTCVIVDLIRASPSHSDGNVAADPQLLLSQTSVHQRGIIPRSTRLRIRVSLVSPSFSLRLILPVRGTVVIREGCNHASCSMLFAKKKKVVGKRCIRSAGGRQPLQRGRSSASAD